MQLPILSGIFVNRDGDFSASYPINREPVILDSGISQGYLRPAPGVTQIGTGPGIDRGGITWRDECYRVMGDKLITVDASGGVAEIGSIGGSDTVAMDYSFDRLAINADENLWYLFNGVLSQVTDPDLGRVIDMLWIDGYFMTTDGEFLVVTELLDPTQIDPLKYGSSEESPDPVTGLMKLHGEVYALNRETIEVFTNAGGTGFPYRRNSSALIEKGCVGPRAKAYIAETFAFVGGGKNEAVGVYLAGAGQARKISSGDIDDELAALSVGELYAITCEAIIDKDEQRLLIHLPTRTLVYYVNASLQAKEPVWTVRASGIAAEQAYLPRNATRAYGEWIVGDKNARIGKIDPAVSTQFGDIAGWQFETKLLYNGGAKAIIGQIELVGTPGLGGHIFFSSTTDGRTWSIEKSVSAGAIGQRDKRMVWWPRRLFRNWMGMRFRGADTGSGSFARLEADIEAMG